MSNSTNHPTIERLQAELDSANSMINQLRSVIAFDSGKIIGLQTDLKVAKDHLRQRLAPTIELLRRYSTGKTGDEAQKEIDRLERLFK